MKVIETLERRTLAALRPIDAATGLPVTGRLSVRSELGRWSRNQVGTWTLLEVDSGVEPGSLTFVVTDADRLYLPRLGRLELPRDPDPEHRDQAGSLFRAVDLPLFLSPEAPIAARTWAVIRLSVRSSAVGNPGVPGALVTVRTKANGKALSSGMTDARGEALVAVVGLRASVPAPGAGGAVVTNEVDVIVKVSADPLYDPNGLLPPDPDDLASGRAGLATSEQEATLAPGRTTTLAFEMNLA